MTTISAWRIVKPKYAPTAFDGEGAALYGGRWNHTGFPTVYCSGSLSLAALELFVQLDSSSSISLVSIEVQIAHHLIEHLENPPKNWQDYPLPHEAQDCGSDWIKNARTAVLKVPSAVIPQEFNYLLNPKHPDFKKIKIQASVPFTLDPRMWKKNE